MTVIVLMEKGKAVSDMGDRKYKVLIGNEIVSENMDIKTATILVKALFEEYYNDHTLTVTVVEMERTEVAD